MKTAWGALFTSVCLIGLLQPAWSGPIQGTTTAGTAWAGPSAVHPNGRDDYNLATTKAITFDSTTTAIFNTANANWGGTALNVCVAGQGACNTLTPIDPSDFNVKTYAPWVVNSNNVKGNDNANYNRGVTNQDAGGANIVIQYTPTAGTDPKKFNFLQAIQTTYAPNTEGQTTPDTNYTRFDNGGGTASPYYNNTGVGGVGNTENNTVPLDATTAGSGWLLDIPYRCESGFTGNGQGCPATTPATDGLITQITSTFDTYIEADQVVNGTTYQVLYGGIDWGYSYSNNDVPEPSTLILLGFGLLCLGVARRAARGQRLWLGGTTVG